MQMVERALMLKHNINVPSPCEKCGGHFMWNPEGELWICNGTASRTLGARTCNFATRSPPMHKSVSLPPPPELTPAERCPFFVDLRRSVKKGSDFWYVFDEGGHGPSCLPCTRFKTHVLEGLLADVPTTNGTITNENLRSHTATLGVADHPRSSTRRALGNVAARHDKQWLEDFQKTEPYLQAFVRENPGSVAVMLVRSACAWPGSSSTKRPASSPVTGPRRG